jgi:hypothetical protein
LVIHAGAHVHTHTLGALSLPLLLLHMV